MPQNEKKRRDPFETLGSGEPVEDLGLTATPAILSRRPRTGQRKTPIRPSEKRRQRRFVGVTFSSEETPRRLRDLARRWNLIAPDGQRPNISTLIEYLLLPQLEAAEADEIPPPNETRK